MGEIELRTTTWASAASRAVGCSRKSRNSPLAFSRSLRLGVYAVVSALRGNDGRIVAFLETKIPTAPALEARGRLVRLGPAIDRILSQHDYPEPVAAVLGEAITLDSDGLSNAGGLENLANNNTVSGAISVAPSRMALRRARVWKIASAAAS